MVIVAIRALDLALPSPSSSPAHALGRPAGRLIF